MLQQPSRPGLIPEQLQRDSPLPVGRDEIMTGRCVLQLQHAETGEMGWSGVLTQRKRQTQPGYHILSGMTFPLHDVFAALSSSLAMRVPLSGAALFRFDDAFELTAAAAWNDSGTGRSSLSAPGSCRAHGMVFPPEGCTADVPDRENKHPLR